MLLSLGRGMAPAPAPPPDLLDDGWLLTEDGRFVSTAAGLRLGLDGDAVDLPLIGTEIGWSLLSEAGSPLLLDLPGVLAAEDATGLTSESGVPLTLE